MYKWIYRTAFAIATAMLFHAFYFWGGVALSPEVGDKVLTQSMKSPVGYAGVLIYAGTGKGMFGMFSPDGARNYADGKVAHAYPSAIASNFDAPGIVRNALTGSVKYSHFGTPFAFAIAFLLYLVREKEIRSLGR